MTHVASAASHKRSTTRLPGFLLSPFGWAAEPLAVMVNAERTLLADLFEMSQPRMHLIALALAHLQPPHPQKSVGCSPMARRGKSLTKCWGIVQSASGEPCIGCR
jgi:hypothetical protein